MSDILAPDTPASAVPKVGFVSLGCPKALTDSELQVVRRVAHGLTNREVAEQLFLSTHTVNAHLRHAFTKLGIGSRMELARLAAHHESAPS